MNKSPERLTDNSDEFDDVDIARWVFERIARYYNPGVSDHDIQVRTENVNVAAVVNEGVILTDLTREQCQERAAIIGYDMGMAYFSSTEQQLDT